MEFSTWRLKLKHLGTHQQFKADEISKQPGGLLFSVCLFNFFVFFSAVISLRSLSGVSDKANTPRLVPREIVTLPDFDQTHPNGELILI